VDKKTLALLAAQELLQELQRTVADNDSADAIDAVLIEIRKAMDQNK